MCPERRGDYLLFLEKRKNFFMFFDPTVENIFLGFSP